MVEESAEVTVDHRTNPVLAQSLTSLMQGVMRAAAWAKTVGDVADILLVDRLQQPRHRLGHDVVLQGRKPSWSQLAGAFGDQAANTRLRTLRSVDEFCV